MIQYLCNILIALGQLVDALLMKGKPETLIQWFLSVLVALDMTANAFLFGDPFETISSRADKAAVEGKRWGCVLCKLLDYVQQGHCAKSLEATAGSRAIIPD